MRYRGFPFFVYFFFFRSSTCIIRCYYIICRAAKPQCSPRLQFGMDQGHGIVRGFVGSETKTPKRYGAQELRHRVKFCRVCRIKRLRSTTGAEVSAHGAISRLCGLFARKESGIMPHRPIHCFSRFKITGGKGTRGKGGDFSKAHHSPEKLSPKKEFGITP
mgnify:CR=1 FL=1